MVWNILHEAWLVEVTLFASCITNGNVTSALSMCCVSFFSKRNYLCILSHLKCSQVKFSPIKLSCTAHVLTGLDILRFWRMLKIHLWRNGSADSYDMMNQKTCKIWLEFNKLISSPNPVSFHPISFFFTSSDFLCSHTSTLTTTLDWLIKPRLWLADFLECW